MQTRSSISPGSDKRAWGVFRDGEFSDHVSLVTGAGGGMGAEIVRAFSHYGARVVAVDASPSGLSSILAGSRERARVETICADLSCERDILDVFTRIDSQYGRIDNVVTCAAIISSSRSSEVTREQWHRVLDVNLLGTFFVLREAVARMSQVGQGRCVAVASDAAKKGGGGLVADAAYAASKAGVLVAAKSLARECAGTGIRINTLIPGTTDTGFLGPLEEPVRARIRGQIPMGRLGKVDEMAAAALFLCSRASSFIYGASLVVDGGTLMQ